MDIDIGDICTPMQINIFTVYVRQFITFSVFDIVVQEVAYFWAVFGEF